MTIESVMTSDVKSVDSQASVADVAKLMRKGNVGFVPVLVDSEVLGVVSDRDILVRVIAAGQDPNEVKIRDIVSLDPVTCTPDTDVEDAAKIMEDKKVRRLVVLDENRQLAGIFSLADLAARANRDKLAGQVLGAVSSRD
jgi:CBS domain-containing protein